MTEEKRKRFEAYAQIKGTSSPPVEVDDKYDTKRNAGAK